MTFTQSLQAFRSNPSRELARTVLRYCQAKPQRYSELHDEDESMIRWELTDDAPDEMRCLAEHYADTWNAMEREGIEPTESALWEVEDELRLGDWVVYLDDGEWKVSHVSDFDEPDRHQAVGNPLRYRWVTIGGHEEEPDKKHAGGTPIEIDGEGNILKSRAPGLQGKNVSEARDHFREAKNPKAPAAATAAESAAVEPSEKPKWNAQSTAVGEIAQKTGLPKNDIISMIAQAAIKGGIGTAKLAGRVAKTLGKHALGTIGIGDGQRASMLLDLIDDVLGKGNAVTDYAIHGSDSERAPQRSAVLDTADAVLGKGNQIAQFEQHIKERPTPGLEPEDRSLLLDAIDAVAGKDNRLTDTIVHGTEAEKRPQSSFILDVIDAVAGKNNRLTDWLMKLEREGHVLRYQKTRDEMLAEIAAAARECETEPTDAQKESGNYKKGHVVLHGLPITIENPKGSIRRGRDWEVRMKAHYGYVKRTKSEADGDHVDVFIGPNPESEIVFVIDQQTKGGRFDEHKAMIGYTNAEAAKEGYLANYSPGWKGFGDVKAMPIEVFKKWIVDGDTGTRVASQKIVYSRSGGVLRYGGTWVQAESKGKSKKWKNLSTGEVRYQPKMPGDRSGRKKVVREGQGAKKPPKTVRTTVDQQAVAEKLRPFDQELDAKQSKSVKASFKQLLRLNKDKVLHRIADLVDDALTGLGKARTEEGRQKFKTKLSQYRQMLEWAGTPKIAEKQEERDAAAKDAESRAQSFTNVRDIDKRLNEIQDSKGYGELNAAIDNGEGRRIVALEALQTALQNRRKQIVEDAERSDKKQPVAKDTDRRSVQTDTSRMIGSGEILRSKSGRLLSPAPKIDATTDRKAKATIKRINEWLLQEAKAEWDSQPKKWLSSDHTGALIRGMNVNNMSQADQDTLNLLVFGDVDGPTEKNRVEGDEPEFDLDQINIDVADVVGSERDQVMSRVIAKFGGTEQTYSRYSTEQLRKMLEGEDQQEGDDDGNNNKLGGGGEAASGGGGDAEGASVGGDARSASTGILPRTGEGDGAGLSGLPAGEGERGVGPSVGSDRAGGGSVPSEGTGDGVPAAESADGGAGTSGGAGGAGGTSGNGTGAESAAAEAVGNVVKARPTAENPTDLSAGNFRYSTHQFMQGGLKTKFQRNVEAIRTLKRIKSEGRTSATPAEQEILANYIGWGQFPAAFKSEYERDKDEPSYEEKEALRKVLSEEEWDARFSPRKWAKEKELLEGLLDPEEYKSARRSTLNAHYTHPDIVAAHWKMAERLGFKGGRFLETSAGIGYYFGMMPPELAGRTRGAAVELDTVTAEMLRLLYPATHVENKGFEKLDNPDNFYDLVASNVPFGDYSIFEERYAKYDANIHDHFFLKSLDLVKPGGLVMHVTSTGTMDKKNSKIRRALADKAELVSAIRFPGSAHKENAGTEVVTDLLILRKKNPNIPPVTDETPKDAMPKKQGFTGTTIDSLGRLYHWRDGKRVPGPSWDEITTVADPAGGEPIPVNQYFADHPEQILGTLDRTGTMYHGESKNVSPVEDYKQRLAAAIDRLPKNVMAVGVEAAEPVERIMSDVAAKEGANVIKGKKLYLYEKGELIEQKVAKKDFEKIRSQLEMRDVRAQLIEAQKTGGDTATARAKLNELYDSYVKANGFLNDAKNRKILGDDPDAPNVLSLENYDAKKKTATKADILLKDTIRSGKVVEKANNITEAIGVSLHMHGTLDMDYMSKILGMSREDVGSLLRDSGLAFDDPKEGWKQADQYLSGNVRRKLIDARAAAAVDPSYQPNVDALLKVQPADIPHEQITIKLGSKWVPKTDIQKYIAELTGGRPEYFDVSVNPIDSSWDVKLSKGRYSSALESDAAQLWKTDRVSFLRVVNAALNNKNVTVNDPDGNGGTIVNREATAAANEKIAQMRENFTKEWVMEDEERRERLCRYYNDNFNNIVPIKYNGSHQTFPGMNVAFDPYPHQKDFIWQVVTTGKGLAAHEVGTGKTASMVTAAMELRRLGLAKKPVIACLKANIGQLEAEASLLYPDAKILSTSGAFESSKRAKTLAKIATGDYDMIFMTHEHLDFMKMKPETQQAFVQKEIDEIVTAKLAATAADGKDSPSVKELEGLEMKKRSEYEKLLKEGRKDDTVYFEDTGIDQLFVDESHLFKGLPLYTKTPVKGVPTKPSERATNMYMRTNWLMEQNGGRGVVFATGTPVSNSMAELYVMQKYLQEKEMNEAGINNFDDWANQFGETETKQEYTMTGLHKPVTRFAKFVNIPELLQMARQVLDVVRVDNTFDKNGELIVKRPKRRDAAVVSPPMPGSAEYIQSLQNRAASLSRDSMSKDNMLKICSDARKYSMDMRLVDSTAEDHPDSKLNLAVKDVVETWKANPEKTQFIFSDVGVHETESNEFTVYGDMIEKLVEAGVPREKIMNFGDPGMTEKKREESIQKLRTGEALFAIGGTKTLGTGVNAQKHLFKIHHLDVPWKPADIEQREGRGWRSGNLNPEIHIAKYVAQPLDQFFWGVVERKAKFIKDIIVDKNPPREVAEEEDSEDMSPGRLAAIASGDPRKLEKVNLEYDVKKLSDSYRRHEAEQRRIKKSFEKSSEQIKEVQENIKKTKEFSEYVAKWPKEFSMKVGDVAFDNRPEAEAAVENEIKNLGDMRSWEERDIGEIMGMRVFRRGAKTFIEKPDGEAHPTGDSLKSIEYNIRHLTRTDALDAQLEDINRGLPKIQAAMGRAFAHKDEMEKKQARIKEIEQAFAEESKAVEQHQNVDQFVPDGPQMKKVQQPPKPAVPPVSDFASIPDVGQRVMEYGKAIKAPRAKVKLANGNEVVGDAVGPFVINKTGGGKNAQYNIVHANTGLTAANTKSRDVAKVAALTLGSKGDWNFTTADGFNGETAEHGKKVRRALQSIENRSQAPTYSGPDGMTDLADLAGLTGVQRNHRMPWNFNEVLREFRVVGGAETAKKLLRYCEEDVRRYAQLTDRDASSIEYELTEDDDDIDHYKVLAQYYADHWNMLEDSGLEPSEDGLQKAADELSSGDWVVFYDGEQEEWRVTHADAAPHVVKYANDNDFVYRCPSCGGIAYAGSPTKSGRFQGYAICSRCGHSFATVNRHQAIAQVLRYEWVRVASRSKTQKWVDSENPSAKPKYQTTQPGGSKKTATKKPVATAATKKPVAAPKKPVATPSKKPQVKESDLKSMIGNLAKGMSTEQLQKANQMLDQFFPGGKKADVPPSVQTEKKPKWNAASKRKNRVTATGGFSHEEDARKQAEYRAEADARQKEKEAGKLTWGGVTGGRWKPEAEEAFDPASLANMSEEQLWHAFLAEQGGNAHLPVQQWTKKAHALIEAWKKKAAEEDATAENVPSRHQHRGGVLRYGAYRVPKGHRVQLADGRIIRGGGYISQADLARATPVEQKAVSGGVKKATKERGNRDVDRHKLGKLFEPHSHHELTAKELKTAKRSFRALASHHKDLVANRLEELANGMGAALEKLPDNEKNARARKEIGRKLRGIQHMMDWVDAGKEQQQPQQPQPSVGRTSARINDKKFHLTERGKGMTRPEDIEELQRAEEEYWKKRLNSSPSIRAKSMHDVPSEPTIWDQPKDSRGANVTIHRGEEEQQGLAERAKEIEQEGETSDAEEERQRVANIERHKKDMEEERRKFREEERPKHADPQMQKLQDDHDAHQSAATKRVDKFFSSWNESQRINKVKDVLDKAESGKATRRDIQMTTDEINAKLDPHRRKDFWTYVYDKVVGNNVVKAAMLAVSLMSYAQAGLNEAKAEAENKPDRNPLAKQELAFKLAEEARGRAGRPNKVSDAVKKTSYQRA